MSLVQRFNAEFTALHNSFKSGLFFFQQAPDVRRTRAQVAPHAICMPGSLIWIVEAKSAYYQYRAFGIVKQARTPLPDQFFVRLLLLLC